MVAGNSMPGLVGAAAAAYANALHNSHTAADSDEAAAAMWGWLLRLWVIEDCIPVDGDFVARQNHTTAWPYNN